MGRMERRSPPPETRRGGGEMERRSPPPGDARDREEFERYCMAPGFRTLHHPESLVDQLVTQRARVFLHGHYLGPLLLLLLLHYH